MQVQWEQETKKEGGIAHDWQLKPSLRRGECEPAEITDEPSKQRKELEQRLRTGSSEVFHCFGNKPLVPGFPIPFLGFLLTSSKDISGEGLLPLFYFSPKLEEHQRFANFL